MSLKHAMAKALFVAAVLMCSFASLANAANMLLNPSFETGPGGVVSLTGNFNVGPSAATNWSIFNDTSASGAPVTTTTELCGVTCPSGFVGPPAPRGGAFTMHITTSANDVGDSGIFQMFGPPGSGPMVSFNSLYVFLISGGVEIGSGDQAKGGPNADQVANVPKNSWFSLVGPSGALTGNSQRPQNEFIIYSFGPGGANFFADLGVADPTPEPGTVFSGVLALGLAALYTRRRRAKI